MPEKFSYKQLISRLDQKLVPSLAQDWPELPAVSAEGPYLYDSSGKRYLDFTSGVGVTNLGHNHPKVLNAAIEQMKKFSHSAVGITLHEPLLQLTERLSEVMPKGMEMFFFGNSGSEAVEGALKLARYVTGRPGFIAFRGSFHGRTFGALSITSVKSKYRNHYEPLLPGVYFADYAYPYRCPAGSDDDSVSKWSIDSVQRVFDHYIPANEVAAIIIEPVQGEGGYIVPPVDFLNQLREICDQNDILLIFDEVQTGFGRTGKMFAAQTFDVKPDIMAIAKGIANGLPLGATVSSKDIMGRWSAGSHGTTFGGNPVACAAALAVQEVIKEENLLDHCVEVGKYFLDGLKKFKKQFTFIGDVRGVGLMAAIEFVTPDGSKTPNGDCAMKLLESALDKGLLAYMAGRSGQVVRFIPPINVTKEQISEALEILEVCMKEIE